MKLITSLIIAALLIACAVGKSHDAKRYTAIIKANFSALDSVAQGLKDQRRLTLEQTAFLYLIHDWSNSSAKFTHYQGIQFDSKDVASYRAWCKQHKDAVNLSEIDSALAIYVKFFKEGLVPETDLQYLERLSSKYRKL